jgi:hypothetical protein
MGREARRRKEKRERGGFDERGPLAKANRRSLKVESQEKQNVKRIIKWTLVTHIGRRRSMIMGGKRATSLALPLGTTFPIM